MHSNRRRATIEILALAGTLALASSQSAVAVNVWVTAGDKSQLLKQQADILFNAGTGSGGTVVSVVPTTTFQTISGFGAAMTDSSAWLLQNRMNSQQRDKLMRQVFSPTAGIGVNYLRLPIGASDFTASGNYSYNDNPPGGTDPQMNNFSIAHDQPYIIPRLQQALALNPDLKFMGSPWSAPGWMKTNGSMIGTGASLKPQYEEAYALYLQKFVQAYEAQGLPIDTLSIQNEPLHTTNYPTMSMTAAQQISIIKNYLGPSFATAGIDTKILAYDHNWDNTTYPLQVLNDPGAGPYVAGSAFHAYAGSVSAQTTVHNARPDKDIYFTEITGGDWATNFGDNMVWMSQNIFNGGVRNWSKNALLWNLALDENDGPHLNGCSNCRGVVTVNSTTGAVTFNEEFYALGQMTKAVQPGAVRVLSSTYAGGIDTTAYTNPDGTRALVAMNPGASAATIRVVEGGQSFNFQIPAKGVATFLWGANEADFNNGAFDDGGFQNGGGSLDAWTPYGVVGGNVSAAAQAVHGGDKSLKLFGQFTGTANASGVSQGISVTAGEFVQSSLDAYIRSADSIVGTANSARMRIEFYSSYGAAHSSGSFLGELAQTVADGSSANDVWLPANLSGIAPAGAVEARLVLEFLQPSGQGGAVHIDDVLFAAQASPPSPADFNVDGHVDALDLAIWQQHFGTNAGGDANSDGTADGADFMIWQRAFAPSAFAAGGSVPEPVAVNLAVAALVAFAHSGFRRRRDP